MSERPVGPPRASGSSGAAGLPSDVDVPTNVRPAPRLGSATQSALPTSVRLDETRRPEVATEHERAAHDVDLAALSSSGPRVPFAALHRAPAIARFGRYELLGRIAFGGMAEIFLAREAGAEGRGGRFVVVKRVLPHVAADAEFVAMFKDEARLAMQLNHPNICHVYAFGEEQGAYFLAMEWVNGMPLSKVLRRARDAGGLPLPIALKVVAHVADALDHAHRAADQTTGEPLGIVHRDVSPQNVMVSYDGVVKLLDFGIAKASSHSTRTEAGVVKGKFAYMAPEQCLGEVIDARADVFALGVCLYELVDGRNPFKRQTEFDTMRALVYEEAPPLAELYPHVPPGLDTVVARALAKRPEDRFQSAAELHLALEKVLAQMGEIVPTARIAECMEDLFANEIKAGPRLDTSIEAPSQPPGPRSQESVVSSGRAPLPPNATDRVPLVSDEWARQTRPFHASAARRAAPIVLAVLISCSSLVGAAWWTGWVRFGGDSPPSEFSPGPSTSSSAASTELATAPTLASLFVDSTPSGAAVRLDGRGEVGVTPIEVAGLAPGQWSLTVGHAGFEEWRDTLELGSGERRRVHARLVPISVEASDRSSPERPSSGRTDPRRAEASRSRSRTGASGEAAEAASAGPPGQISLNTRPWSRVYLGGRLLGTTPLGNVEVPAGTHRLRLVDRDGVEHARTITVASGEHAREFFDLTSDPGD